MPTLLLSGKDVRALLSMSSVIDAVEQAFRELASGEARMPAKAYLVLDRGDFRAMPAALPGAAGMKWVSVFPQDMAQGLPTVIGTLIYSDPSSGYPLAIMDASDMTAYRTGAAAAIASKYLARWDSHTLGIIGAGRQAHTQLLAHAELFRLDQISVFDPRSAAVDKFIEAWPQYPVRRSSLEEAATSDIVCTLTPAREPVLRRELVNPGTHINAIGADAEGKEELEPAVLREAVVVVDDLAQASSAGEINVPLSKGLFRVEDVFASLGEIISGRKPFERDRKAITVFDSTGLGIEDIAVARLVYEQVRKSGRYLSVNLID